jgi:hypothetical protein
MVARLGTTLLTLALIAACGGGSTMVGTGSTGTGDGGSSNGDAGSSAVDAGSSAGDAGSPVPGLVSISLSQTDIRIPVGGMTTFAVTATYSDGSHGDVSQQAQILSSDPSIATIAHGQGAQVLVTAIAPGTATIQVTFGGLVQNAAVTVTMGY